MDSTAVAMPPSLVWDLFTDLAACGKDNITLRDIDTLTRRIVECIRAHLPCPSGLLVLQTDKDTRSVVHWGIDHQQEQKLLSQNGHQQNLNMVCLEIAWQQHTIGQLFLGKTAHNATLFSEGFITALRNQLELLIHLHYDEISKIEQTKVSSFSFNDLDIKSQSGIYEALQLFLEHVATFSKAEAAVIYLHNNEHYLQLFASHGLNQNNEKSYVTIQDGFVGQIAKQRVSVIPDSCSDQNHHLPDSDTSSWQSCVGVPLEIQEELLGVLLLLRTEHYPVFQEADIQALEQEIKPAIVLLWNVHLLAQQQQYERELFVLYENAHTISSTNDVEPILSRTVENTAIAMGADTCALHLYDTTDPTVLYEAVSYSSDTNDRKVTLSYSLDEQPIIQQLLQTKERTLTFTHNGTHTNNHLMSRLSEFMGNPSGLIIPLTAQDQTAGLLYIGYNDTHRYFNNVEVNFAHTVANQVALSVINALSQQASQRQTTEFQQLQTISQQLNASQTLDEILTILFEELSTLITFKGIQLCLYEANEQQLHIWRSEGIQTDTSVDNTHYSLSDSLGGWVARYRTPLRLSNLIDPPVKPTVNELVNGDAIHSYIGLPLCIGSQLYGVLELFSSQINAFSAATERILSLVADITTRAVAALHQHEQTDHHLRGRVQQLTALQRISRHLTSTIALDRILSFALKEVLRATPATHAYIALQEGQKDDLEVLDAETLELVGYVAIQGHHNFASYQIMATAGYSAPDTSLLLRKNLSQGTTAAEKALVDGEATIVDEISDVDDRVEEIGPTIASALAIPIFYEDHIVGVVNIHSIQPHAFDHEAVEFVRALTDQIALAIGNAQSYQEQVRQRERLQQRASLLNEMLGIGQALRADRSLEDILEQVAFSVVEIARYRSVLFNLVDANDPDIMRVTTGAGLPLTELERLRNGVWPQVLINKFIDKKYRLGRCFFVPSSDFLAITSDIDIEDIHVTTVQGHREANEWQPDDLLLVPLYSTRAKLLGVMSVDDPFDGQRPTERSLEALAIFADQAAIAIENAYLLREERNQAEHMRALFQVSAATVATFDLDELLMRVYNEIVAYMGTPSFLYVASYDDQTESTCFEIFMREGEILTTQHKQTYPKGGLTGWVIDTGKAQYIHDSAAEEKNLPVQPIHLGETVQSWVGIPLRSQRQIIGVLSVQSFEPYAFSDHHIQFLSTLANQLAVALENTHLFQERERRITELDVINQISRITNSTLDLHKMLGGIYACLTQFLTIDAAYILVRYEKSKEEAFVFKVDKGIREFHKVSGELVPGSLTEYIIRTKQPLLLRDLQKDKAELSFTPVQFGNEELESASWLGVPLLDGDNNVLGIFSIQSYIANTYSDRELAFMTTVASQAALGIQNVWLFDQTQRSADALQGKVGELGTLLEAARVLSSSLKPQEVLDMLMEVVGHQLAVNTVALWTINDKNILLPAAMLGIPESVASTLNVPVGGGLTGQVAATNQPLVIDDVEKKGNSLYAQFNRDHSLTSFMGVPVVYQGQTIGVLSVMTVQGREFNTDEIRLLSGMADQAAIALENARLFEERERRIRELTALNYISERINATLALDELLVELHQGIGTFLDISNSFIALHDIKTNHLTFPIHWNRGSSQPINGSMIVEDVNCLSQRIVIEQRPILLRTYEEVNALSSEKPEEGPEQTSSWLGVPIMQGDDVLGIINVQSYHSFAYDEDDQRFLMTVASQVATALANARLFAERERRLSEVSVMRDISSAITSTLDLNDMLERLIVELGRVIDVSTSLVVLYDKDEQFLHYPIVYDRGAPMHIPSLPITRGGINRWVITHRQSLLLHTNEEAEQYRKSVDSRERVGSGTYVEESFLVVPIVSGDETLGVINIQSYETSKFSEDDLRFVSTVANQAAIAINNAHVFQERGRRIEELATFNEIGQQLSVVSDLDQLFNLIYTQTSRLLDTTNFYIALYDERHGEFTYPLYYGSSQRSRVNGKNIEDNFNSAVVETRIPVLRKGNDIRKLLRSRGIHTTRKLPKSWLAVPMVATDHVLGVIAIRDYEREQAYTQDDLRLLSTIASWGAIAFENARLLGETRQSFKEIEVLYAMSVSLSSTLDSTEVQHIIASSAIEILSGEICVLFLFDEQQKVSQHTILDNQTLEMTVETPEADHILAKLLLEADRPVALNDVNQLESPLQDLLALGIQSAIGTLIGPRESPIGAAWVGSRQQRDWQEREQSLMLIFASQSGQAMESARLFHEVRTLATELEQRVKDRTAALAELNEQLTDEKERLQAIHAITLELTASLDLNETLTKTLGLASRTVNVQRGSVMLLDQESKQLICHAVLDKENVVRPVYTTVTFMEGQSLVDWVVEKKKPVRIADVQQDERWVKEEGRADEVRSVVAIPLVAREEPLGVLLLTSPKVNYFTEAQLQLLWTIANESAIAINNAILFSFISEMGERRATLLHQQSEETSKNQAILQSLGEGVIVLDEDQKVILFNPAAQEMLDIPAFSVLHQPLNSISTLGHNLETRQRADIIHAGLQDGLDILSNRDQNINRTLELPSPTQTLDLNFAPVFSTEHTKFGSVVVLRDVTREIEADRAKQNFISSVSHELRTPLTSIKGYVDLLLLGAGGPIVEAQLPYLNVVKNNTKRLMDLINDILEIGRIDADKIELNLDEVDIPSIVHDVLQTMHAELERKSITASIDLQDNLPLITADPRRLTQVIMNLVSNAIKYTYPEGAIMVRTVLNPAGMVQMDVEDNGVGISEEDQKHLFRRFYRADNPLRDEAGGTGLGLVIAKSYIERHSGEMWVSSKLGQGSAFSFIIPVKQAEPKESIEPTTDS